MIVVCCTQVTFDQAKAASAQQLVDAALVTHMQLTHIDIDVLVVSIHTHACVRTCVFAEDTPATTTASPTSITEGSTSTVTLTTTGVANGTSVPYTITGAGTGRVTTALTGNVTVNSNSATLSVVTTNDSVYTGDQTVTVTFNSAQADPCGQLDKTAVITIQDNETAPTTCEYVSVPVVWCGQYNGNDNQLEAVTVLKSVMLPKALAGEATVNVPKTLTVTKGNPSTITVATTEAVASSALLGGFPIQVITTFNTVATKGLITGSATTTVYGY